MESNRTSALGSNYNDQVIALRYVYVLALSLWFGGTIIIGLLATPASDVMIHRFFRLSYLSGALLIVSLFAMALLGPRPSGYFARMAVAIAMYAVTIYAGRELHMLSQTVVAPLVAGGLALLFWEARDGTRAA
jgi:hypothetical protein